MIWEIIKWFGYMIAITLFLSSIYFSFLTNATFPIYLSVAIGLVSIYISHKLYKLYSIYSWLESLDHFIDNFAKDSQTWKKTLYFEHIPSLLCNSYDEVKKSWFRYVKEMNDFTIRSRYVYTNERTHHNNKFCTNNDLFIEISFHNKKQLNSHILIEPDIRENKTNDLFAIIAWPGMVFLMVFWIGSIVQLFTIRSSIYISNQKINPIITTLIVTVFIGYFTYLFYRKNIESNMIKLEDVQFEEKFDINGTNTIITRQILSPTFMQKYSNYLLINKLSKTLSTYIDFRSNRIIFKFDYKEECKSLSKEFVEGIMIKSAEFINDLQLERNMAVVYAGRVAIDGARG